MNDPADSSGPPSGGTATDRSVAEAMRSWLRELWSRKESDASLRETLEELIEERIEAEAPIDPGELVLLANILELRDRTVRDVMVPRVDIVAVSESATLAQVIETLTRESHSRLPVYRGTLDNPIGMVHIKDVLSWRGQDESFLLRQIVQEILFVAPSMRILDLLLEMRMKRIHMALVVDEFGGIEGLVTIEDLVEEIVGEIDDEHDRPDEPELARRPDGDIDADARASIETLEAMIGPFAAEEEREEVKSLGGLVFSILGRVPDRGEIVAHPAGVEFEIRESDARRVKRLRVRRRGAGATRQAVAVDAQARS